MLFHVISTAVGIDLPAHPRSVWFTGEDVNDVSGLLVLIAIDKLYAAESTDIIWLSSGSRIERGSVENHARAVTKVQNVDNIRVKFQQVRFVVVDPLGFHPWSHETITGSSMLSAGSLSCRGCA